MIKLAIIGTGRRGNGHAKQFRLIEGCHMVACCDIDAARAEAFAKAWEIPETFTDPEQLLAKKDLDAVAIVTSDSSHCELAVSALQAGKHVLCEKPLATNVEEAEQMVAAAQSSGLIHQVAFSYRRSGALYEAARLIDSGALGQVRQVEGSYLQGWLSLFEEKDFHEAFSFGLWRLSKQHSDGTLGDIGVHLLDFCTFPVGPVAEVFCATQNYDKIPGNQVGDTRLDANDSALITLRFCNGAMGTLHTTRWAYGQRNSIRLSIWGTEGALKIDLDEDYNKLQFCNSAEGGPLDFHLPFHWQTVDCPPVADEFQRFISSIQNNQPVQPDFERGAEIQRLIAASFASAEAGTWVPCT